MAIKACWSSYYNLLEIIYLDSYRSDSIKINLSACRNLLKVVCLNSGGDLYRKNSLSAHRSIS
jgi:hypothetical protein